MRSPLNSVGLFSMGNTILAGLMVAVVLLSVRPSSSAAADSQRMPLAEQSLLLDGQVIGDRITVVGERGHILVSEDQGKSWQQQVVPTRATLTSVFFIDQANGWAAGHDSVILQTRDGGRQWREIYSDPEDERPILDLWFRDKNQGYAVGAYGLFLKTLDGGKSWHPVDFSPTTLSVGNKSDIHKSEDDEDVWIDFHLNQITSTSSGRIFVAAEAGNLYRSDDGCRSWLSLPSPYEGSFYGSLPVKQNDLLAFGLRGNLFRIVTADNSWHTVETNVQATLNDGIYLQDGRIVLAGLAGTLLVSEDDGQSFTRHTQNSRSGISKIIQANDGALILIGEAGVKRLTLPAKEKGMGQ